MTLVSLRAGVVVDDVGTICMHCGKPIPLTRMSLKLCSRNCQMKAWRAVKMLEGTHGWVGRGFRRLPKDHEVVA